jgi:hypothetical protein
MSRYGDIGLLILPIAISAEFFGCFAIIQYLKDALNVIELFGAI